MYFRKDITVQNVVGQALAGAHVYVCEQPADITTRPPSPLAMTWSDPDGYWGTNDAPLIADGKGNVFYYAEADFYTEVFYFNGRLRLVRPDQMVGCPCPGPPVGPEGPVPYTFSVESSNMFGQPQPGQIIALYTAFVQSIAPVNFFNPTSYGNALVNPQATAVCNCFQNSTPVGTVSISPSGIFTFQTPGFTLQPGDIFWVTAPNPMDAALSDLALSFVFTRTS